MNTIALWPTTLETGNALAEHYGPAMDQAAVELGPPEWEGWLLPALLFEPEPISAARLHVRSPYTSERRQNECLAMAARQGFLAPEAEAEDEYRLTDLGSQAADGVLGAAYAKMSALHPAPAADLERLAALLHRLVLSCLSASEPPGKWSILHSRRLDPGEDAPVVVRIDQYISDLAAYRDDAHLAAWQYHQVEGRAWEALTCLWRGEAATPDELHRKLARRGYSRDEYVQALDDLVQSGWAKVEAGTYQVAARGREIRQAAEDLTDQYFYAPWSCLSQGETEELGTLLNLLCGALQQAVHP